MKTILITGVCGFTGKHFVDYIKDLGLDINIIGIDVKKSKLNSKRHFRFIKCDLLDKKRISSIVRKICPDYIFHFAGVNFSNNYKRLLDYNVIATLNLLDAAVKNKTKSTPRILIVGSSAEYGITPLNKQPIIESIALRPVTPYGVSKASQDLLSLQYYFQHGLHIVLARPFNIIGPGQPSRFICGSLVGQIKNMQSNKTSRLIVGNLHTKRDFVDIRDVVKVYWMLLRTKKNISGEVFNIGSGKAYSIREIVEMLLSYCSFTVKIKQKREIIRLNDIPYQRASIAKIKRTIKWHPEIPIKASLKDMLKT